MSSTYHDDESAARLAAAAEDAVVTLMRAFLALQNDSPSDDDGLWPLEALAQLVHAGNDWEKEEAAAMLRTLAKDGAENQLLIAQAGAVAPLMHQARFGNVRGQREWALRALYALADENAVTKQAIASGGGIAALVGGFTDASATERELTMWVLSELALHCDENQVAILDTGVAVIAADLLRGDATNQKTALTMMRNLSYSKAGSPAARFIEHGVLDQLLRIVQQGGDRDDDLTGLALRSLFSLSTESNDAKVAIINCGVIQPLVSIVRGGADDGQKQIAAQILANLSSWQGEARERVIVDTAAIQSLMQLLRKGDDDAKMRVAHVMGNLAYAAPENRKVLMQTGVFGPLVRLIRIGNDTQKSMAMMAIGNLAHNNSAIQNLVAAAGVIPLVVESLRHSNAELRNRAADVLGDIVSKHPANQISVAFADGVTEALVRMLRDDDKSAQERTARALGKLARGNTAIQGKIVRDGAVPALVTLLSSPVDDVTKCAARALCALTGDLDANRIAVAKAGAIGPLVRLYTEGSDKPKRAAGKALKGLLAVDALREEVQKAGGDAVLMTLAQADC